MNDTQTLEGAIPEAEQILAQYEDEPTHPIHVATLSVDIFNALGELHCYDVNDLILLRVAACLHDTGWSRAPDGAGHHKHSADIIREHAWRSLAPEQAEIVSQVARYHRKALPDPEKHELYRLLPEKKRKQVKWLAGILRVADALDHSHTQSVRAIILRIEPGLIVINPGSSLNFNAERAAVVKKGDLLKQVSGCRVRLVQ